MNEQGLNGSGRKNVSQNARKLLQLALILWIGFIWLHSAIPATGSSEESRVVGNLIRPFLELFLGQGNVTDHVVRKLAHFTEYTILGMLMGMNVKVLTAGIRSRIRLSGPDLFFCWSYGLLLAAAVALIDESIQLFSPGRSAQVTDVLLDTGGSTVGLLLCLFCVLFYDTMQASKRNESTPI